MSDFKCFAMYTDISYVEYCRIMKEASKIKNRRCITMKKEDVVLNEVIKRLKKSKRWYNKIIIDIFKDLFYYVYREGMNDCFKYYNK